MKVIQGKNANAYYAKEKLMQYIKLQFADDELGVQEKNSLETMLSLLKNLEPLQDNCYHLSEKEIKIFEDDGHCLRYAINILQLNRWDILNENEQYILVPPI